MLNDFTKFFQLGTAAYDAKIAYSENSIKFDEDAHLQINFEKCIFGPSRQNQLELNELCDRSLRVSLPFFRPGPVELCQSYVTSRGLPHIDGDHIHQKIFHVLLGFFEAAKGYDAPEDRVFREEGKTYEYKSYDYAFSKEKAEELLQTVEMIVQTATEEERESVFGDGPRAWGASKDCPILKEMNRLKDEGAKIFADFLTKCTVTVHNAGDHLYPTHALS